MKCPLCKYKSKVRDSRLFGNRVKRYRECKFCMTRFITYETLELSSIPEYLRNKIEGGNSL